MSEINPKVNSQFTFNTTERIENMKRISKDLADYMQAECEKEIAKGQAAIDRCRSFFGGRPPATRVQICAGAGVAMVLPMGAKSLRDALHTVRYFKGPVTPAPTEFGVIGKEKREEWALSQVRQWAQREGYEIEEIPSAPW